MTVHPVAIIGAGHAGVSIALSLNDSGVAPVLVERHPHVGAAWRSRYDRLRLNTSRRFSHLPGRPFPRDTALYPSRDDVVAHLDHHSGEAGITQILNTDVERIDRTAQGWRLRTDGGDIDATTVVVATGCDDIPVRPGWPGEFTGELLHSSQYRNPFPYRGM